MTTQEIITKLDKILVDKRRLMIFLKNHEVQLYQAIIDNTAFLNATVTFAERLYCIRHNLNAVPVCNNCKINQVKFRTDAGMYRQYCSTTCQRKSTTVVKNRHNTCLERYGTTNFSDKCKITRFAKYNSYHPADFSKKVKQTKLLHFGDENFVNKEKIKQTCLEKYGVKHVLQVDVVKEKIKQTCLEKYGVENPAQAIEIKEKAKQTCLEKYGVEYALQADAIKDKRVNTLIKKYNCTNSFHIPANVAKRLIPYKIKIYNSIVKAAVSTPMFTKIDFIENAIPNDSFTFKCNNCNSIFTSTLRNGLNYRCEKCYPTAGSNTSTAQYELFEFIKNIYDGEIILNNRTVIKPLEVDVYIPEKKLAIEFDGLYWHNEHNRPDKNYHLNKTELCAKAGIKLIHIFEDEWFFKQQIVKAKLRYALGKISKKIYARKCTISEIDSATKNNFLDKYHIQGADRSNIKLGLFYNKHLVAIATFAKSRFNKNYQWELTRYATIQSFNVIGGFGKLLSHFEATYKPNNIVTYADRRWSIGTLYDKLGFELSHISPPNYFYVRNMTRQSRLMFQKHKLAALLETFDPELSEIQNMIANGYNRIFDCGNLVYVKQYKNEKG